MCCRVARALYTTAFLLVLTLPSLKAQARNVPATFRTDTQLVLVPITATDRDGKTVEGLRREDFSIFEDKEQQQIESFNAEDAPCSVGMVLDISGSMRNSLDTAKGVAHAFFETANTGDEFLLLTVSTQPDAVSKFTSDVADIEERIRQTSSGGMTALIDTVYLGLNQMRKANQERRALLIFSDGLDNFSRYSKAELMRAALEADVQIYTIVVGDGSGASDTQVPFRPGLAAKPIDQARTHEGPNLMEELATRTGGIHFYVRNAAEAKEAAMRVSRALRNQYIIGYHPASSGASGKWHQVRVKSRVPKVKVYARNGYYEP